MSDEECLAYFGLPRAKALENANTTISRYEREIEETEASTMASVKFTTNHSDFFKEWRCGNVRILNDIYAKVFYHYEVQTFNGKTWDKVQRFRTLSEAKAAASAIALNF